MILNNNTILRGFLAHLQSQVRERAALIAESIDHPDATPETRAVVSNREASEPMRKMWEEVRRDIRLILGVELRPFHQLARPGSFVDDSKHVIDPLRITLGQLKPRADKARRQHPEITLLKSWDLEARKAPKEEAW